ncbi:major capsid protein [Proteus phage PM2]|nr:major capsid protein [Proteus phage PM2]ASZ76422.1 major capsid protein [Proteus phage PM2]
MEIKNKDALIEKWGDFMNNPDLGVIEGTTKQAIMAKILENQEMDIHKSPEYRDEKIAEAFGDFLTEAEVGGDHGYDASNIAMGKTSGAVTQIGPAVMGMVRRSFP